MLSIFDQQDRQREIEFKFSIKNSPQDILLSRPLGGIVGIVSGTNQSNSDHQWYGKWYMVYGIWYMVYGLWYMV